MSKLFNKTFQGRINISNALLRSESHIFIHHFSTTSNHFVHKCILPMVIMLNNKKETKKTLLKFIYEFAPLSTQLGI